MAKLPRSADVAKLRRFLTGVHKLQAAICEAVSCTTNQPGNGSAKAPQATSPRAISLETPQSRDEHVLDPQASQSSADRNYRPELAILRFIAFMFVFITHSTDPAPINQAQHPWLYAFTQIGVYGVPVFFLLSAFLITELPHCCIAFSKHPSCD